MEMTIHPHGYWIGHDPKEHRFDRPLAQAILNIVRLSLPTMVDIGCGDGSYVRFFLENNLTCHGYDGNPETVKITNGICWINDFSKPLNIGKYDTVLSLEVGEHIPPGYEHNFIVNLINASKSVIILSWAVEGQGGFGHVNCHDNNYIIDKMKQYDFKHIEFLSSYLRKNSTLSWFKHTLMVFMKEVR
jgi:hypothetical protein